MWLIKNFRERKLFWREGARGWVNCNRRDKEYMCQLIMDRNKEILKDTIWVKRKMERISITNLKMRK